MKLIVAPKLQPRHLCNPVVYSCAYQRFRQAMRRILCDLLLAVISQPPMQADGLHRGPQTLLNQRHCELTMNALGKISRRYLCGKHQAHTAIRPMPCKDLTWSACRINQKKYRRRRACTTDTDCRTQNHSKSAPRGKYKRGKRGEGCPQTKIR